MGTFRIVFVKKDGGMLTINRDDVVTRHAVTVVGSLSAPRDRCLLHTRAFSLATRSAGPILHEIGGGGGSRSVASTAGQRVVVLKEPNNALPARAVRYGKHTQLDTQVSDARVGSDEDRLEERGQGRWTPPELHAWKEKGCKERAVDCAQLPSGRTVPQWLPHEL